MNRATWIGAGIALIAAAGCIVKDDKDRGDGGAGGAHEGGAGEGGAGAGAGGGGAGNGGSGPLGWTASAHTCSATSRTDALFVDADGVFWVGCGSTQVGYGLHRSIDGGASFAPVATTPEDVLASFRVNAIARGDSGELLAAGFDASGAEMVFALDTASEPMAVTETLVAGNQVGTSFHVGSMAVLSGDRIFVESLTGFGALYRSGPGVGSNASSWDDAYYWASTGVGYQLMDVAVSGDALYGAGSTIIEPPMVFLPPTAANAEPYAMVPLELPNDGWTGEMWGVAADAGRVVVTGVNQDAHVGKIYVSGADAYDAASYTEIDIDDLVGAGPLGSWGRGACIRGERIAVVGERQPLGSGTGFVLLSTDGGQAFTDITPDGVGESVTRCTFLEDGALVATGAASFFGIYR
jgi:hypothetical protein